MKKTFSQIRDELQRDSETRKFEESYEVRHRFDVKYLKHTQHFIGTIDDHFHDKIEDVIDNARDVLDSKLFKKLTQNLWEFRIRHLSLNYRFLAFWDYSKVPPLVLVTHGFIKKTSKVPQKELERANAIRSKYFLKNN